MNRDEQLRQLETGTDGAQPDRDLATDPDSAIIELLSTYRSRIDAHVKTIPAGVYRAVVEGWLHEWPLNAERVPSKLLVSR